MALEQIQGKAGSLTPDELDRLALQYKPSWEIDEIVAAASVVAVVSSPQANGAHALGVNGNGAASHARADSPDKPKILPPTPASAPRAAGIKTTVMGTGALAEAPLAAEAPGPAPAPLVEAVVAEQPAAPVESAETAAENEGAPPVAAAPEDAAPPADVTEPKETADVILGTAATIPATVVDLSGLSEPPIAVVAEHGASANENAEEIPEAKPVSIVSDETVRATRNEAATAAEPPLDAIPMQSSSSGSIMKVVFALVAIVGIAFFAKGMLGGSEKDKPKPTTNAQATTAPKETAEAKPEQPATPPPEMPKAAAAATESPKPAKTDAPPVAEQPKATAKTVETPKVEAPKPDVPKPVVTTTATAKATVAIAPKPPATAPAPRPTATATATAKTGGGIIRETPF